MPTALTDIQGIGPHTASILKIHGYTFADDLAKAVPEELADVPGFRMTRALHIIAAAQDIVAFHANKTDSPVKIEPSAIKIKKVKKLKKKPKQQTKKKKKKEKPEKDTNKAKKSKKKKGKKKGKKKKKSA